MSEKGEALRIAMRHWTTGVSIVTSVFGLIRHGMTVNSLASASLEPPVVLVTLANATRTHALVIQSGICGITILSSKQAELADRFAGRGPEEADRFHDLALFSLVSGAPLIQNGLAFLDCRVQQAIPMENSTLFLLDVIGARQAEGEQPLVYFNRGYHRL